MELGNEIVNKIFEANYDEKTSDIKRATDNCDSTIREKWIKAKYVDKKFVLQFCDSDAQVLAEAGLPNKFTNLPNKWSVKKIRRRSCKKWETIWIIEFFDVSFNDFLFDYRNNNNKVSKKELNGEEEKDRNEELLILGESIIESSSLLTETNILSVSDHESTSGEEEIMGNERKNLILQFKLS